MDNTNHYGGFTSLSQPEDVVDALNKYITIRKISSTKYYLKLKGSKENIISNVPEKICTDLKINKFSLSKINRKTKLLIYNLQDNIDIFHRSHAGNLSSGDVFRLNECHHNSTAIFHLCTHLKNIEILKKNCPIQIVLGYVSRKIPFGTQFEDTIIESSLICIHDWHVWNYVNGSLVDVTLFANGNLLPVDCELMYWGESRSHVFIYPPEGIEYYGMAFDDLKQFNESFERTIGFDHS